VKHTAEEKKQLHLWSQIVAIRLLECSYKKCEKYICPCETHPQKLAIRGSK